MPGRQSSSHSGSAASHARPFNRKARLGTTSPKVRQGYLPMSGCFLVQSGSNKSQEEAVREHPRVATGIRNVRHFCKGRVRVTLPCTPVSILLLSFTCSTPARSGSLAGGLAVISPPPQRWPPPPLLVLEQPRPPAPQLPPSLLRRHSQDLSSASEHAQPYRLFSPL